MVVVRQGFGSLMPRQIALRLITSFLEQEIFNLPNKISLICPKEYRIWWVSKTEPTVELYVEINSLIEFYVDMFLKWFIAWYV